jgi:hypothetical protein
MYLDVNIPKEHAQNLFSKANDVWFLCKTNLAGLILSVFSFLFSTGDTNTEQTHLLLKESKS